MSGLEICTGGVEHVFTESPRDRRADPLGVDTQRHCTAEYSQGEAVHLPADFPGEGCPDVRVGATFKTAGGPMASPTQPAQTHVQGEKPRRRESREAFASWTEREDVTWGTGLEGSTVPHGFLKTKECLSEFYIRMANLGQERTEFGMTSCFAPSFSRHNSYTMFVPSNEKGKKKEPWLSLICILCSICPRLQNVCMCICFTFTRALAYTCV